MFVSTLLCGSKMLNRNIITSTTSGELGFRNRVSTRDDIPLTDFGVCFPDDRVEFVFSFAFVWWTRWRVFNGPITEQSKSFAVFLTLSPSTSLCDSSQIFNPSNMSTEYIRRAESRAYRLQVVLSTLVENCFIYQYKQSVKL